MKKAEENGLAGQVTGHFMPSRPTLVEGAADAGVRPASAGRPLSEFDRPQLTSSVTVTVSAGNSPTVPSASIVTSTESSRARCSLNLEPIQSLITNWAVDIRRTKADAMEVVLKPNAETEVALRLSLQHGTVDVAAEFKRGDLADVAAYWPQLQESLSGQGIRLAAIQSSNGADLSGRASTGGFNQSDRRPPAPPESPHGFDSKPLLARTAPHPARTSVPPTPQGGRAWESWA